jgi:hypothetical protein
MNPTKLLDTHRSTRNSARTILFWLVLGSCGFSGCRSTLPPEQPSRLWEVFGRQSGKFFPRSDSTNVATQSNSGSTNSSSGGFSNPSPVVQPRDLNSGRSDASQSQSYSSSAMIPPLPRDIR